ncbi:hypothetical protein [Microbacterium lacus]|uniref:hypothetical protein n=1 Tax=Microbacterium lacus TaxID=415217 RepID=UPI0018E1F776|nr:hypothetical protein [Microbacterium lacus]
MPIIPIFSVKPIDSGALGGLGHVADVSERADVGGSTLWMTPGVVRIAERGHEHRERHPAFGHPPSPR